MNISIFFIKLDNNKKILYCSFHVKVLKDLTVSKDSIYSIYTL